MILVNVSFVNDTAFFYASNNQDELQTVFGSQLCKVGG